MVLFSVLCHFLRLNFNGLCGFIRSSHGLLQVFVLGVFVSHDAVLAYVICWRRFDGGGQHQ